MTERTESGNRTIRRKASGGTNSAVVPSEEETMPGQHQVTSDQKNLEINRSACLWQDIRRPAFSFKPQMHSFKVV